MRSILTTILFFFLTLPALADTLAVNNPVAVFQADLDTIGTVQLVPAILSKQLYTKRLPNGQLRIIIHGLNQTTFSGQFLTSTTPIIAVTNIVAGNPDGTSAVSRTISIITTLFPAPTKVTVK